MIVDKNVDNKLIEAGVKFLPVVGDDYRLGISFDDQGKLVFGTEESPGKKVLVLGESHYSDEELPEEEMHSFTREVLKLFLEAEERQNWMRTFVKFERALANCITDKEDSKKIWNHLMFYNYLQNMIQGPRLAGTTEEYERSVKPFLEVLKSYRPDYIIVWGKRLFENLSESSMGDKYVQDKGVAGCFYSIDGYEGKVIPVNHPSVGFAWDYWHGFIVDSFK